MLSPSDFNNAVPQFTNGNYASNPINPQYIAEPDAVSYNRGAEPLQTLPAQWWNWFLNKITGRFNKVNVYVKNIFNELAQVLSIFNITPDGTEQSPTTSQLKTIFECCYPEYVKTTANLASASTTVNGHPLSENVTVTRSDLGLGTASTVNTGTAVGCIPTVGTALGTTNNNILVTDASGNLKPSGITVGTAAGCDATAFRPSSWTPTVVECANKGKKGSSYSAFGSNAFNSTAFTTCTGTVTQVKIGSTAYNPSSGVISLPAYPSTPAVVCCAMCNGSGVAFGASATKDVFTRSGVGDIGWGTVANKTKVVDVGAMAYWNGAYQDTSSNLRYYCGGAFGTAAACAATCFLSATGCAADSAKLGGTAASSYVKITTGKCGNVNYIRNACTKTWTIYGDSYTQCDMYKAVIAASGGVNCLGGKNDGWFGVTGFFYASSDSSIHNAATGTITTTCFTIRNEKGNFYMCNCCSCTQNFAGTYAFSGTFR